MSKLRGIPLSCLGPKALAQLRAQGIDPAQVGKGPKQFNLPVGQLPLPTKDKYHRSAVEDRTHDGEVFDSKLELAAHRWLTDHDIQFERQVEIEIQPGFEFAGKKIRKISYFADFKIIKGLAPQNSGENSAEISGKICSKNSSPMDASAAGEISAQNSLEILGKIPEKNREKFPTNFPINSELWVDMKGMETPEFKLKWKLVLFKGIYVNKVRSVTELVSLLQKLGFWQNQQ